MNSNLSGFYRLSMSTRRQWLSRLAKLPETDEHILRGDTGLQADQADHMTENAIGILGLPLGVCVNLRVDQRDRIVPMVVEEPSVIAAASHAAKLLRAGDGITTAVSPSLMIGQIQILDVPDRGGAEQAVLSHREALLAQANDLDPVLVAAGGGAVDIEIRHLPPPAEDDPIGPMVVVHLLVDVRDAMGANSINTMCERLGPRLEELTAGRVGLRILSNLADRRTVRATGSVPLAALGGRGDGSEADRARGIEEASAFAERDPYRAATHNKGIMNGIDAVLLAFGQDWRAVEAGAHAYAARGGRYTALARWRRSDDALLGELELPLAVGTVGGITGVHPTIGVARRIAGVMTAADLASLVAAVGLAQNLGALRALAAEGIQRGHMRIHARNVAMAAGAVGAEVQRVARTMADRGAIDVASAGDELNLLREQAAPSGPVDVAARFRALRHQYGPRIEGLLGEAVARAAGR